jgi:hypothetical protein
VRVANQGILVLALNRWSLGGLSRRWGTDARGALLGRARDLSLSLLRALVSTAAGPRLRKLGWTCSLFPGRLARVELRIPLGDVIGLAVELAPR